MEYPLDFLVAGVFYTTTVGFGPRHVNVEGSSCMRWQLVANDATLIWPFGRFCAQSSSRALLADPNVPTDGVEQGQNDGATAVAVARCSRDDWHQDEFNKDRSGQKQSVNTASAYAYVKKKLREYDVWPYAAYDDVERLASRRIQPQPQPTVTPTLTMALILT